MQNSILKASADVGNSSTKIIVTDGIYKRSRKQTSVVSYLPMLPKFEDEDLDVLVTNLHKNIVVHFSSSTVRSGLYAVGDFAQIHNGIGFNIDQHKKAEQDITIIQPISMIAVSAIQNEFDRMKALPDTIHINVEYSTAIPVVDYTKANARALENRLLGNHILIVHVGEDHRVTVSVNITDAKVVQEGIPAFYALVNGPSSLFVAYNERYKVNFSGKDFAKRKILFIDIGDGTIELIYVENGKPVITKSSGARMGVGHASQKALQTFVDLYKFNGEITRSKFMDKVLNHRDKWHNESKQVLSTTLFEQENRIYEKIKDTIENVLTHDVDDLVVFGGGANVFRPLENHLINYTDRYKMRVLWITGNIATMLTAIGLDDLNQKVFFK